MASSEFQQTLAVGTIIRSPKYDYRIEQVLGQGGFGITYKVSTTVVFDKVPIFTYFTIKEHFMKDACERGVDGRVTYANPARAKVEESRGDFLSEARRLGDISGKNSNVVPVNEVFEANNTVYYVMEYLNGGSLRDLVRDKGKLTEQEAIDIETPIAEAMAFLHEHRINHLDIKPDNVMFRIDYHTGHRMPVLIDFGLAKHFDEKGKPTSTIRMQGCSDGYAPVEQYSGLPTFSPQADVYALGALLYYMLVGRDPIIATEVQADTINRALPGGVSDATRMAISSAMAYNKADRTPTVNQFLKEINPKASGCVEGVAPTPIVTPGDRIPTKPITADGTKRLTRVVNKKKRMVGKKKIAVIALAVVAVLALVCVGIYVHKRNKMKAESEASYNDYNEDLYSLYKEECEVCDSLAEVTELGDYESLCFAKSLLKTIESTEQSFDAQYSDYAFNLSQNFAERLNKKLQQASWGWKAAGDAQMEIFDYQQALDYYKKANDLFPSDSLAILIRYNKNMVDLGQQQK